MSSFLSQVCGQLKVASKDFKDIEALKKIKTSAPEIHPDYKHIYEASQNTRRQVLPVMYREQARLKKMGFPTAALSSVAVGINLPGEGSDLDLVIRAKDKNISAVSEKLESLGIPFKEKVHHYNLHTYRTAEGVDVDLKVFEPHIFDYQQTGFQNILKMPEHEKAEIIYMKSMLKDHPDAYKKYKNEIYMRYGTQPRDGVYPDSLTKKAEVSDLAKAVPLVLGAGLVIYDLYKSGGYSKDVGYVGNVVSGKNKTYTKVETASYAKRNFPGVKVVDTPEKFKAFFMDEHPLAKHLPEDTINDMSEELFHNFTAGNAAAASGKKGYYLIAGKKVPSDILEHELGHLRDFKAKRIRTTDGSYNQYTTGLLNSMAQAWCKRRYLAGRYKEEVNAWDKAKPSETMPKLRDAALGTYEKSWHRNRVGSTAGAMALYAYLLFKNGTKGLLKQSSIEKISKALTNAEKAQMHHASPDKDWVGFEENLASKGFQKAISGHPVSDDKLKQYVKNYGGYLTSKKVVASVPSRTGDHSYEIRKLPGGRLGCGCKDWQYKHSWKGTDCDHIYGLNKDKTASRAIRAIGGALMANTLKKKYYEGKQAKAYSRAITPKARFFSDIDRTLTKHLLD